MLNKEQIAIIDEYVNAEYYDTDKLKNYLEIHEVVGNEVFDYVDRKNRNLNRKEAHDSILDDKMGYIPVSVDVFVKRIPFYFYTRDDSIQLHGGRIGYIFNSKWKEIETSEITLEEIYQIFEYMFYQKGISPYNIFNYIVDQTNLVTEKYFFDWVEYLHLCEELHWDDLMPDNFIVSYNRAREAAELEPMIIIPEWDAYNDKPYIRQGSVLTFEGTFPCDEDGNPIMKWIGLKVINPGKISGGSDKAKRSYLNIEIKPDTIIYYKDTFYNEKPFWNQVYAGPLTMDFDSTILKERREAMNYSQNDVAKAVGTNLRTYQKWEYGETQPNCYFLLRLMNWLNISNIQDTIKFDIPD